MEILPAIDIKDGRAVRLFQGDYAQVTTFPDSVLASGRRWQSEGATWLHVVDLDGARAGWPVNSDLVLALRRALPLRIEVGGGLRTTADVDRLLDAGIDRVILGTAALGDAALLDYVLRRDPDALAVALDARDGFIATAGWLQTSASYATDVALALARQGVRCFSHTDIARDGAMGGPNYAALTQVQEVLKGYDASVPPASRQTHRRLIAAGGVASLAHVQRLRDMNLDGAIIGRALYSGAIRLPDALALARQPQEDSPCQAP